MRHKASCRYVTGNKRCQICEIFIKWDALFCPCCGYRLRNGPRSFKFKAKLRIQQQKEKDKKIREAADIAIKYRRPILL